MPNTTLQEESVLWSIYSKVKAATEAEGLSYHQARKRVIATMASSYNVQTWEINQHSETNMYPNVSKITRLIFPKPAAAATNLNRELQRGGLAFNDALVIARGNAATREECRKPTKTTATVRPAIDLSTLFVGIISSARQGGHTADEIKTAFQKALHET